MSLKYLILMSFIGWCIWYLLRFIKRYYQIIMTSKKIYKINQLQQADNIPEALKQANSFIQQYQNNRYFEVKKSLILAKAMKGSYISATNSPLVTLEYLNNHLKELFNLPPELHKTPTQSLVMLALLNKGLALEKLGRFEQALAIYDEGINLFLDSNNRYAEENLAKAINNKSLILFKQERYSEQIENDKKLLDKFFVRENPEAVEIQVGKASVNYIVALIQLKHYKQAQEMNSRALQKYQNRSDEKFRPILIHLKELQEIDYPTLITRQVNSTVIN